MLTFFNLGISGGIIFLGFLIYFNSPKNIINKLFLSLSISTLIWILTVHLANTSIYESSVLFWARLTIVGPILFISTLLHFSRVFPGRIYKNKYWGINVLTTVMGLLLLLFIATPLNVKSVTVIADGTPIIELGYLYIFLGLFILSALIQVLYNLLQQLKRAGEVEKKQIKYFFIGIFLTVLVGVFTNLVLTLANITDFARFGPLSVSLMLATTGYAITKYGLFNIKVVLAELAVAVLIILNIAEVFTAIGSSEMISRLVILAIVLIAGILFVRSVQNEVKRREEVEELSKEKTQALDELEERNRNLATLQKISDIVLNESDMKIMVQKILDELPKELESCVGGMLSIVKQGQLTGYSMSSNNFSKKIISLVGGDLNKYSHPISREFNLIHRALIDKESVGSDKLTDFISPPISKPVALSIQKLIGVRHVEAFPLIAGGEPLGVMLFVFSKTKEEIHSKNYSIAKAISDDMSLAIQRAQAFVQLKEANEYLSELDKMKDEFISMASHELNTPLAAIEGYLSMILDEGMGKIDKQSRKYLNRAYASSKRLAELIMDLLNVSRIEQGRLKMKYVKTNMAELAQSVIHELQIKADEKKLYLKLVADKTAPETWFDPERIREVIVNLTGNALKFTSKGGVTIKIKNSAKKILVEIIDTGRGVDKDDQSKLFHKFSQIKRDIDEHQGSGLGLYISKNFIELHKGKIWVDSDTGKGSTFSFEIPIITKPPKEVGGAILERSVKTAPIETPKKDSIPEIITDSTKEGV